MDLVFLHFQFFGQKVGFECSLDQLFLSWVGEARVAGEVTSSCVTERVLFDQLGQSEFFLD